ncbi:AAA family ATPase [Vibrio cyclitrophicus]|uniref:AAA family ATPase n=1 Tax=Vibrio cyclitrophicus TaxID=47951 RepID=UPI0011B6A189|nr:AAA family ATPase [Vibrio cyclitrophicus]
MLTRNINFKKLVFNSGLNKLLNEYYNSFNERTNFKGYRYEQDKWENIEDYNSLLFNIQDYLNLYLEAYNNLCPLCLSYIDESESSLIFAHPIGSNREYPELIMDIKNIMPICKRCEINYKVTYKKKRIDNIESIYDLTRKIPSIVIPHLESTLNHITSFNNKSILSSRRLNNSLSKFIPSMLGFIHEFGESFEPPEIYQTIIYSRLHSQYISNNSFESDFDYAEYVKTKNANYSNQLVKNQKKNNNHIGFSPRHFSFKNLRELRTGELELTNNKYLCILGENGVGKTTLMQSIYTSICSDRNRFFYDQNYIYRKNYELLLSFHYNHNGLPHSKSVKHSVGKISRSQSENNISTRFKKDIKVVYLDDNRNSYGKHEKELTWLFEQSNSTFSKVAIIIKNFLDLDDATLYRNGGSVFADFNEKRQDLSKLSSGYKAIISIIIMLSKQLEILGADIELNDSYKMVALIDEIELHLHPKWKNEIVNKLISNFPEVFFIITTHDPLVLQQCEDDYCIKIEKGEKGRSEIKPVIEFNDYDVDMLLSSPLFEIDSSHLIQDRLKKETLRQYLARKIINESLQNVKNLSLEELSMKLELAVRNEKD